VLYNAALHTMHAIELGTVTSDSRKCPKRMCGRGVDMIWWGIHEVLPICMEPKIVEWVNGSVRSRAGPTHFSGSFVVQTKLARKVIAVTS